MEASAHNRTYMMEMDRSLSTKIGETRRHNQSSFDRCMASFSTIDAMLGIRPEPHQQVGSSKSDLGLSHAETCVGFQKNPENFHQHFNCTQWTSISAPIQYQNQVYTQTHLLELPRCNGSRIEDWIDKCDRLFYLHRIPPESKVRIASCHLEGSALQWHLDYMRARFNRYPRWYDYVFDISMRFGNFFDDPLPPVTQVKPSVSLQGYVNEVGSGVTQKPSTPIQNQFSTPISRVDSQVILPSDHYVNTNLTELKYATQMLVKLPKPTTIELVAIPTKSHETPNTTMKMCKPVTDTPCFRSEPIPNKPVVDKNTHAQTRNTKPIFNKAPRSFNASELADREAKGLCMFCDELLTPEHLLKHKRFKLLVMEREEDDEPIYGKVVDGMELDDGSSTCKFLELDLAEKCNLTPMTVTKRGERKLQAPHLCRAFNWHLQQIKFISNVVGSPWKCCHMIPGAQRLSKLGPSLGNFSRLPMKFFDEEEELIEGSNSVSLDAAQVENLHLSKKAVIGVSNYQGKKETKPCSKDILSTLIDSGSTSNFLGIDLAKNLIGRLKTITPLPTPVVDGMLIDIPQSCKRFFGQLKQLKPTSEMMNFLWRCCKLDFESRGLNSTNPVNWVFSKLPMEIYVEEEITILRGTNISSSNFINNTSYHEGDSLYVLYKDKAENSFEIPYCSLASMKVLDHTLLTTVEYFIMGLHAIFDDSTHLHIPKVGCDHRLPLMGVSNPFPLFQQWVIHDRNNPYAFPVVLVSKNDDSWGPCVDLQIMTKHAHLFSLAYPFTALGLAPVYLHYTLDRIFIARDFAYVNLQFCKQHSRLLLQLVKLVVVMHRKMIERGSVQAAVFVNVCLLPRLFLLVLQWAPHVIVFHRKMIDWGRVRVPLVLIK